MLFQFSLGNSVIVPFTIDKETNGIVYLDSHSCYGLSNKYECLFLPPTNCTTPYALQEFVTSNSRPKSNYYSMANEDGLPLERDEFFRLVPSHTPKPSQQSDLPIPPMNCLIYGQHGAFNNTHEYFSYTLRYNTLDMLINYGFFYRLNFFFRSRVAEYVHGFFTSQSKRFPTNGDCIALHIRRGDRIPRGEEIVPGDNARDWCRKHQRLQNGSCWNEDTNEIINDEMYCWHVNDYGCLTANPYGGLVVQDFLDASRVVDNSTRNVLIVTDASDDILRELENATDDRNIFVVPTPHFHRKKSTENGIAYAAAVELVSQCTSFVGHSESAVTMFMMRLMCATHLGKYEGVGCPKFFDFNYRDRRRNLKILQHTYDYTRDASVASVH